MQEHFLVPDHTVQAIKGAICSRSGLFYVLVYVWSVNLIHVPMTPGASFAGFYYVMYTRSTGIIEGYYYHSQSELCVCMGLLDGSFASLVRSALALNTFSQSDTSASSFSSTAATSFQRSNSGERCSFQRSNFGERCFLVLIEFQGAGLL